MDEHESDLDRRLTAMASRIAVPPRPDLGDAALSRGGGGNRQARLLAAAGLLVVLGFAVLAFWAGGDGADTALRSVARSGPSSGSASDLRRLLDEYGVDLDTTPPSLLEVDDAEICGGLDGHVADREETPEERCFLDAHLARLPAVLVERSLTTEGEPVVTIHRTATDGTYAAAIDSSQDTFGEPGWSLLMCERVTTRFPEAPEPLPVTFFRGVGCTDGAEVEDLPPLGTAPAAPRWFTERAVLPLCGIDVHIEDEDRDRRLCFRDAVEAGLPAEFAYTAFGDEGESGARWFRSLGEGRYEVIERIRPGGPEHDRAGVTHGGSWTRLRCPAIESLDGGGSEIDLLPDVGSPDSCTVLDERTD